MKTTYLCEPHDPCSAFLPGVGEVSVAQQEQMHGDAEADVHVDGDGLAGAGVVVHQDHRHHPAAPLVRLVRVHDAGVGRLLGEEHAHHRDVQHRQPEVDRGEVLVLLHEEIGPVADVEVGHDEGQLAQGEEEGGNAVVREIAEVQLARPWYGLVVVPLKEF